VGAQCGVEVMHQADVRGVVQRFARLQQARFGEQLLGALMA
jgi:hypothetical protein